MLSYAPWCLPICLLKGGQRTPDITFGKVKLTVLVTKTDGFTLQYRQFYFSRDCLLCQGASSGISHSSSLFLFFMNAQPMAE